MLPVPSTAPTICLAPMEGVLDHTLRDILTRVGGIDRCVSEFIRVTDQLLPARVFTRIVPELRRGSRTAGGVPVRPQLLGSDPTCLAENAARLAELQPAGIDLNFGCPAKTVNRHRGGAVLLDEPELIHRIVSMVRRAVPADVPLSAKMRLGVLDDRRAIECAQAIDAGGAGELVVHARTKAQGYRPPAYWDRIADVRRHVGLKVVANGDIWTVADARRCLAVTGCSSVMIGRGLIGRPGLGQAIHAAAVRADPPDDDPDAAAVAAWPWREVLPMLAEFWVSVSGRVERRHRAGRIKQWLNYLRVAYPQAQHAFDALRLGNDPHRVTEWLLAQHGLGEAMRQRLWMLDDGVRGKAPAREGLGVSDPFAPEVDTAMV